jgi:hypothetical protein
MCAAPGGKSVQIADNLMVQISPDPSLSRGGKFLFPLDKGGDGEAEGDL